MKDICHLLESSDTSLLILQNRRNYQINVENTVKERLRT